MSDIEVAKPVIFLVGPTASGKTSLSIQIAKFLETEIISADSRYFYCKMDIGTAKPSLKEMDGIRHHMIDIADPSETISVAFFKEETEKIISDLHEKQKIPIVVGGTGQYIHAIIHNWSMPQIEPEPKLREFLEKYAAEHGKEKLYKYLEKYDPEAAEIIDFRNVRRTIRAIEVIIKTGRRFSTLRKASTSLYDQKIIGIHWDREELYRRIDQRIEEMIANGFIEEVEKSRNKKIPTSALNAALEKYTLVTPPPVKKGKRIKFYYATQVGTKPPVFVFYSNLPYDIPKYYQQGLRNMIRHYIDPFIGSPIFLKFEARKSQEKTKVKQKIL